VLGLLLSTGVTWLISAMTPITMTITIVYILLALLFSGGIGILAGIYPAFKASRLDPIIALTRN
jgi:putative ABC transport system permease protein